MRDPILVDAQAWHDRLAAPGLDLEARLDLAVQMYREAASKVKAIQEVQAELKEVVSELLVERGGEPRFKGDHGECYVSAPSVSVRYDSKALDALCESSAEVRRLLLPHRKESERAGSLVIK